MHIHCKEVQRYALCGYEGVVVIGNDSWLVQSLCHLLDLVLCHGLRDLHQGYWPVVHEISHSDTLRIIQSLKTVSTSLGKGRAWLYHTLTEGSLQSYVHCLCQDVDILHRHYVTQALLRDTPSTQQFLTLLAGLEQVQFNLDPDAAYLDMAAYQQQHSEVSSDLLPSCGDPSNLGLRMTLSMTSSLASPVDSGVALLDSDGDNTSISEATINETDNLSLRDDKEDDSDLNEIEDNRINHQLQTLDTLVGKGHKAQEGCVSTGAKAEWLYVATKEQGCDESEKAVDVGVSGSAATSLVDSPESKVVAASDVFQSRASSVMTASDITNQNVSEDVIIPSVLCGAASFVESKNKVNCDRNVLEDGKPAKTECKPKQGTNSDDIVFRRQHNKKKRDNVPSDGTTKVKRVSFHEDFIRNELKSNEKCGTEFSVSFLPPNSVIKRDAVKGRYTWCSEGDAPFMRQRNKESDTKSDIYLLSSSAMTSSHESICMEDPLVRLDQNTNNINSQQKDKCMVSETAHTPPVTERGTPEGQEDPPNCASSLCLHKQGIGGTLPEAVCRVSGNMKRYSSSVDWSSDSERILASDSEFVSSRTSHLISSSLKENCFHENASSFFPPDDQKSKLRSHHHISRKGTPLSLISSRDVASKTSLFNKFMRSLAEKKFMQKPKVILKPSQSLYIPGARNLDRMKALEHFKTELAAMGCNVQHVHPETSDLEETFRAQVFLDSEEVLYKVFKVSSSYCSSYVGRPLLALLTNVNLYLTGVKSNYKYCNQLVMPYTDLDAMLVGPNLQTVLLVGVNRQTQFLVVTGNRAITEQLVGHIEIAMRRAPMKPPLPSVRELELDDMKGLVQDVSLPEGEAICHYSLVHLQDHHVSPPSTPLGPTKEGHLMFRPALDAPLQPWEPGFFLLKAGVVYMFGDKSHRLPKRVIPLKGNGCRRISHARRPHTFEILVGPRRSFQFAAADEYEASDWLQAFVQAASGVYEEEKVQTMYCSLVVTECHLVTCLEKFPGSRQAQILSCAAIQDLTAFTIDSMEHSWCVVEFACREVHESTGDWVLYFASPDEMHSFMDVLQELWPSLQQTEFPLCPLVDVSLSRRCTETSALLASAWNVMLPTAPHASL
ncbi:pleckstrin homology domain-containing family M member 2 isoform X2 [Zootermopsis nevadensis]|uniref:pleckstrin homology domain-containing family M member 2 isoform X2 n=1 Tax=Zootermopsis nevadensis TaxID=136037 RepID=UPI000B8E63D2|nr:pleckstrin homology domain-containing family M member 2 isoform X2 [Zootermopsis nevadensis]